MRISAVLLVATIIFSHIIYGQSEQVSPGRIGKNVVQASAGFGGVVGAYNANYERLLILFEDNSLVGLWGKAGLGQSAILFGPGGPYQHVSVNVITGKNRGHFELSLGGARMFDKSGFEHSKNMSDFHMEPTPEKSNYVRLSPVGSLGYRFQKPEGGILFRTGLGYPEGVFIGIGVGF